MPTVHQLIAGTKKVRKPVPVKLTRYAKTINGTKLEFRGRILSSAGDSEYVCYFQFDRQSGNELRVLKNGKHVGCAAPSVKKSAVKVRCSCADYRFTFYPANKQAEAHMAPNFPVVKGKGTGVSKNPELHPGMCKHLLGLANALHAKGYLS